MKFISISISNGEGKGNHFIIINAAHIIKMIRCKNGTEITMSEGSVYQSLELPSEILEKILK